ncbi:hypothetical protein [Flocculibacter collagenilyticus]|uniref:hypothetical protein n=1 Tax=Flocculibacter collagenilyticus TaxID=2744479 RepID=UPI0018F3BB7A|nr:hypothetical protein [Flocculibacter collagenilyticus]
MKGQQTLTMHKRSSKFNHWLSCTLMLAIIAFVNHDLTHYSLTSFNHSVIQTQHGLHSTGNSIVASAITDVEGTEKVKQAVHATDIGNEESTPISYADCLLCLYSHLLDTGINSVGLFNFEISQMSDVLNNRLDTDFPSLLITLYYLRGPPRSFL